MARAAEVWLAALDGEQRALAAFPFAAGERENWHFIPRERRGLPLKQMTPTQRERAQKLLATALSTRGHTMVQEIASLESVLAEMERDPVRRDPEKYFFSVFGTPGTDPWGWRYEGHHVSLNITVAGNNVVVATPQFFGSNPAEVRSGPRQGFRALGAEEDMGRALLKSLSADQRKVALIAEKAPADVINVPGRSETTPQGIAWTALDAKQRDAAMALVRYYVERFRPEIAGDALTRLAEIGAGALHFAWAGGLELGEPHYYRLQSDWFVVEYDNTQNDANHAHTVWREFGHEFGHDVLAEHYQTAHAR